MFYSCFCVVTPDLLLGFKFKSSAKSHSACVSVSVCVWTEELLVHTQYIKDMTSFLRVFLSTIKGSFS